MSQGLQRGLSIAVALGQPPDRIALTCPLLSRRGASGLPSCSLPICRRDSSCSDVKKPPEESGFFVPFESQLNDTDRDE